MVTPDHPAHSNYGGSKIGVILKCPAYVKISSQYPNKPSAYAKAGTLAHKIAELKATKYFIGMGPKKYSSALKKLKDDPHYDPDMDAATDKYLEVLKEQSMTFTDKPFVALETKVSYEDIAPNGYGIADCIMIGDDTIVVADYKNGTGVPVEAEYNPQLVTYAYGALRTYSLIYGDSIKKVRLVIVQPHSGGVKSWETTREELETWIQEVVVPAVEISQSENPPAIPGDWCDNYFCPACAQCRARAEGMLSVVDIEGAEPAGGRQPSEIAAYEVARQINPDLPPLLSDEEIGEILAKTINLTKWVESLKTYAFSTIMSGKSIPGWKLAVGNKSKEWTGGINEAFPKLQEAGIPEAILYERKPLSPAAVEKAVGKKTYEEKVAPHVTIKPGGPLLKPASDKRQEWLPAEAAFQPLDPDV